MCGIAGIVGPVAAREDAYQLVGQMTQRLRHRGPDDHAIERRPGAVLGHRRLSILDPSSAGRQPMRRGPWTLVYNGEIYNFHQLRSELEGPFHSNSDSEVLLHLLERDGAACLDRLIGMFAFAVWNEETQTLFAARDRLGIKPLLYRPLAGGLAFASEADALVLGARAPGAGSDLLSQPPLDASSLRDLLTYKYVPTPKTVWQGIHKLPPGNTLTFRTGDSEPRLERWWQASIPQAPPANDDDLFERFEDLMARIVTQHTLSDVPVGVFLSGGLDSTTLAVLLEKPRTFTLGFDVASHDESAVARRVAEHVGAHHTTKRATGIDLEDALERFAVIFDEPFGDHGAWPMVLVSKLARVDVKVALSGEGGDELFGGYQWYDKVPRFRTSAWHRFLAGSLPPLLAATRSSARRAASGVERYAMFLGPFTSRQKTFLMHPDLIRETGGERDDYDDLWHFRRYWRDDLPVLKRLQWADLHTYLVDDMLTKVDRASMSVSLEARPPFVDHRMVELALSLPARLLRRGGVGKLLTRRLLAGRVPTEVLSRKKIGFSMPVRRWAAQTPGLLRGALGRLVDRGVLSERARRLSGRRLTNEQTWTLLALDRFLTSRAASR